MHETDTDLHRATLGSQPPSTHERSGLKTLLVPPAGEIESRLATLWQTYLGIDKIGRHDNFFQLGGNSVVAIQITANARKAGLSFSVLELFQHSTIAQLAALMEGSGSSSAKAADQLLRLPSQSRYFESNGEGNKPAPWALLLTVEPTLDTTLLEKLLLQLVAQHEALRLHFPSDRLPVVAPVPAVLPLEIIDMTGVAQPDRLPAIVAVAQRMRSEFHVERGLLVKFALCRLGEGEKSVLLIAAHPLAVDFVSAGILLKSLQAATDPSHSGRRLSSDASHYWKIVEGISEFSQSPLARGEVAYWAEIANRRPPAWPAPREHNETLVPQMFLHPIQFSREDTQALVGKAVLAYRARVEDFILAGLVKVLCDWTGDNQLWIDYWSRLGQIPGLNLQDSVGAFTTLAPVVFEAATRDQPGALLTTIKEQVRAIPRGGSTYAVLRYLHEDQQLRRSLDGLPRPSIGFAYLGELADQPWANAVRLHPSSPVIGVAVADCNGYAISVQSFIQAGRLNINWSYDRTRMDDQTIQTLARAYRDEITVLIDHCLAAKSGVFTPSDFPLADLSSKQLRQICKLLEQADAASGHELRMPAEDMKQR